MSTFAMVVSVGKVSWKLRETMARRKITNRALASVLGVHAVSVSRLKSQDTLPAIGGDEVEKIRTAINTLSQDTFGYCSLKELVGLEDD